MIVDYPTPARKHQFKLYEYTHTGPKYLGTYTPKIENAHIKTRVETNKYETHYHDYHQYIEFKNTTKYYDCTPWDKFTKNKNTHASPRATEYPSLPRQTLPNSSTLPTSEGTR